MDQTSDPTSSPDDLSGIFTLSPSLYELDIESDFFPRDDLALPWYQITTLRCTKGFIEWILTFVSSFPKLQVLDLDNVGLEGDGVIPAHLASATVKAMSFTAIAQEDVDGVFQYLTLPSLQSLTVSSRSINPAKWPVWESPVLDDFLTRSACSLTSLSLTSIPITDCQVIALIQRIPTLTSLRIEELKLPANGLNKILTSAFLQHLIVDRESYRIGRPGTSFLPLLAEFTCKVRGQDFAE
ncbi:hypothetical protein V5O48_011917 [Marasmius crinis-equi]|uniref:Uncharacterized protein n=1 Tax=Marasmius crinis-equi TaxID=585013 RepID=A0ABR3F4A0_9AGAR